VTRVVVVASHRRSGTHLVLDSLRSNGLDVNARYLTLERLDPAHERHLTVEQFDRRRRRGEGTTLVKTHTLPDPAAWRDPVAEAYARELLAEAPTVYVHRDGRDTLVSLYHYVASYSPQVAEQSFGEFMRAPHTAPDATGLSRAAYWQHHVLAWLDARPTTLVGYAELLADFPTVMAGLGTALGLGLRPDLQPVELEPPAGTVSSHARRVRRAISANPGVVSTAIRPRTGGSGGWQAAFEGADLADFDRAASEAMRRLGYA
jgi:hypothetical protein